MTAKTKLFDIFRNLIRITRMDRVLHSFTQGRPYDSLICKLVPNIYQYPKGTIRKMEYNGINFVVDIHDYIGHYIYYGFENPSQANLFNLCKPNDVCVDIGTNIGFSLLNMAKIVGQNGFVIGFEPDPSNFYHLEKNISFNTFSNIKVLNKGLGDKPGKFKMEDIIEFNSGGKRIVPSTSSSAANFYEVEVDTLDNFLTVNNNLFNKIDIIKIDVEGFEFNVLKGAMNTIRKYSPVLYIELDDNNLKQQASGARELIQLLTVNGYTMLNAESKNRVDEEADFRDCHYDIICRRKSHT